MCLIVVFICCLVYGAILVAGAFRSVEFGGLRLVVLGFVCCLIDLCLCVCCFGLWLLFGCILYRC